VVDCIRFTVPTDLESRENASKFVGGEGRVNDACVQLVLTKYE